MGEREGIILSIDFQMSRSLSLQDGDFLKGWDPSPMKEQIQWKEDVVFWDSEVFL